MSEGDFDKLSDVRVGELLLSPEDLQKKVPTKRGDFTIRIANPLEKQTIMRNIARALGHAPVDSITAVDYYYATAVHTIDIVVKESPDWYKGATECRDDQLITDLYNAYRDFEEDFRRRLRENKFRKSK